MIFFHILSFIPKCFPTLILIIFVSMFSCNVSKFFFKLLKYQLSFLTSDLILNGWLRFLRIFHYFSVLFHISVSYHEIFPGSVILIPQCRKVHETFLGSCRNSNFGLYFRLDFVMPSFIFFTFLAFFFYSILSKKLFHAFSLFG